MIFSFKLQYSLDSKQYKNISTRRAERVQDAIKKWILENGAKSLVINFLP